MLRKEIKVLYINLFLGFVVNRKQIVQIENKDTIDNPVFVWEKNCLLCF